MTITIYHVDINGTIIGTDSTDEGATVSHAVTESISRSINKNGELLTSNEQSYYHWLRENHKQTYKEDANRVLEVFPQYQEHKKQLEIIFSRGLFPSFINLLQKRILSFRICPDNHNVSTKEDCKGSVSEDWDSNIENKNILVFRTFGRDRNYIMDMLKEIAPMKFITCDPNELSLEIYQECIKNGTHIFVQDNYVEWNKNGKSASHGKIIREYPGTIQYGLDDNHCMYAIGDNITIIKVNTVRAALDENYYTDLISLS